jgi:hypothetical protein
MDLKTQTPLHNKEPLKHLHQRSVCDHAQEILDDVKQSNPVHPLENFWDPRQQAQLSEPWISLINPVKSLPVSACIDSLIGPSGLLTYFSPSLRFSSLPPTCTPSLSFMGGVGKQ